MSKTKHTYIVQHRKWQLEGEATSPQNACRKAFRTLIKAGHIKRQPKHSSVYDCGFDKTFVRRKDDNA